MMIYVDEIKPYLRQGKNQWWCHMVTDGDIEELHQFAAKIGLRREWFQGPPNHRHAHYDLKPSMRARAIEAGAKPITLREFGRMLAIKDGLIEDGDK